MILLSSQDMKRWRFIVNAKKVQKALIEPLNRDLAGASSISEINVLIGQLKEIHRIDYQSSHINWIMWANRIQASAKAEKPLTIIGACFIDNVFIFSESNN